MRRDILGTILLTGLLLMGGCGGDKLKGQNGQDTLERVLATGELRAAYFIEPPTVMKDPNSGELSGTYIEAINAIAKDLGVKVRFVEVDLAKFAAGLQNGSYDISVGSTFKTVTRAKSVAFTDSIFYLGYDGVVKKGREAEFRTEGDVDRKGITVAVKEGSAIHTYVNNRFQSAKIIVLSGTDLSLPLQAVSSGQADVGLMNEHTVEYYGRSHEDVSIVLRDSPIQILGMGWAVRQDDQKWLNLLNTALEGLKSTGQMAAWERQYYGKPLRRQLVEPEAPTVQPHG